MNEQHIVKGDDRSTWLGVQPLVLHDTVRETMMAGEVVVGWKYITEHINEVCYKTGYMVITLTGITYFGMDGIATRSSAIHPYVPLED